MTHLNPCFYYDLTHEISDSKHEYIKSIVRFVFSGKDFLAELKSIVSKADPVYIRNWSYYGDDNRESSQVVELRLVCIYILLFVIVLMLGR